MVLAPVWGLGPPERARTTEADETALPPQKILDLESVDAGVRARVRLYTQLFYDGKLDELYDHFSAGMREVLPREDLEQLRRHTLETYGHETKLLGEEAAARGEFRAFVRWARFDKHDGIMEVQWRLRPDDSIAGFLIRPARKPDEAPDP